jgi:hypothetical protein
MTDRILLSKTSAAEWLGISRSTLSGYLANGRIEPHSLAGEGARACLDINRAVADLRRNLDPEQLGRANRRVRLRFFRKVKAMDDETAQKFADLESAVRNLQSQLATIAPKSPGKVICMKEAAARLGISRHTMRRRVLADPTLGEKIGGRWQFRP